VDDRSRGYRRYAGSFPCLRRLYGGSAGKPSDCAESALYTPGARCLTNSNELNADTAGLGTVAYEQGNTDDLAFEYDS
jgi:hypothetical protein